MSGTHYFVVGCWNNQVRGDNKCMIEVINEIKKKNETRKFDFGVVLGDNNYPYTYTFIARSIEKSGGGLFSRKEYQDNNKNAKERIVKHSHTLKPKLEKIKIHELESITFGLNKINDIGCPIYMIYGNHDYEPLSSGSKILVLDYIAYLCKTKFTNIILPEMRYIPLFPNFELRYNTSVIEKIKSLISKDKDKNWEIFDVAHDDESIFDVNIEEYNESIKDMDSEYISYSNRETECLINNVMINGNVHTFLSSNDYDELPMNEVAQQILGLPMFGKYVYSHYPLLGLKKKKETPVHSEIIKSLVMRNCKYYFCADTHNYQKINITKDGNQLLTHYIVGTGGAEPDDVKDVEEFFGKMKEKIMHNGIGNLNITEYEHKSPFGFLDCVIKDDEIVCDYIATSITSTTDEYEIKCFETLEGGAKTAQMKYLKYKQKYLAAKKLHNY